ncbi:MAG: cupin domain-containing protein [Microbacterium sp.]
MSESPVDRVTLSTFELDGAPNFASVEVRRITIAPDFHAGAHWHNGPVFGVIESGSVHFQVGTDAQSVLHPGDTFYEPGNETIGRFDATGEGVTFLAWFPVPAGSEPELTMGAVPDAG